MVRPPADLYLWCPVDGLPSTGRRKYTVLALLESARRHGKWLTAGVSLLSGSDLLAARRRLYDRCGLSDNTAHRYAVVEIEVSRHTSLTASLYTDKWTNDWKRVHIQSLVTHCRHELETAYSQVRVARMLKRG